MQGKMNSQYTGELTMQETVQDDAVDSDVSEDSWEDSDSCPDAVTASETESEDDDSDSDDAEYVPKAYVPKATFVPKNKYVDAASSYGKYKLSEFLKGCFDACDKKDAFQTGKRKAEGKSRKKFHKRPKLPYTASIFYRDYHNPNVQDLDHIDGREFRLDYRMPWTEVEKLVKLFVKRGWVVSPSTKSHYMMSKNICPPEIKILGTLYWLGEGCSFRTIYNLSGRVLTAQTFCDFAKIFCSMVCIHLAPLYICPPKDVHGLKQVSRQYTPLGFPGACGSVDGVQIAWEGCPFGLRNSCIGKEGFPTLGFNVTVDHECRVIHCGEAFMGRFNDKTKVRYDEYVRRLREGRYEGFTYKVYAADGSQVRCVTPYLICDNGYHRWKNLMPPYKTTSNVSLAVWSKHLESTRKDVERTFGCVKKRFRIVKVPLLFQDAKFINDIFVTCLVLHNKLLTFDQQFDQRGGHFRNLTAGGVGNRRRTVLVNNVRRLLQASDDFSSVGDEVVGTVVGEDDVVVQVDSGFEQKRRQLATHLYYLFRNRRLKFRCKRYPR